MMAIHDEAPIQVLLVDDEELVRSGFRLLLELEDGIEVVGEAANGSEAVSQARATRPDVIVMDIRMPGVDGIVATAEIAGSRGLESSGSSSSPPTRPTTTSSRHSRPAQAGSCSRTPGLPSCSRPSG